MIIGYLLIAILVRAMVDMMLYRYLDILRINHIQIPEPGWKLEALKVIITITFLSPIYACMAAFTPPQ